MIRLYRVVVLLLLVIQALLMFWRPIGPGIDFWAHASVGRWIVEHGAIPDRTINLWTADIPWVYHSWLSQVIFYGLASLPLPVTLCIVFVLGIIPFFIWGVVFVRSNAGSSWLAVPLVFIYLAMVHRLAPRQDLFTSILLSVVLLLVSKGGRALYAIPPLFALWANLHGAVVIGLVMLAVTAIADAIQDKASRRLALVVSLSFLAVNVNPYGIGYWRSYASMGSRTFARLGEWLPLWKTPYVDSQILIGTVLAASIAIFAWAMNKPQRRLSHLAWLLISAGLFVQARRNVSIFLLVSLAVTALNASSLDTVRLWSRFTTRPIRFRWAGRVGVVVFLLAEIAPFAFIPPPQAKPPALERGFVQFAAATDLSRARTFHDFENSAYLHWRCRDLPLFIDGINAYPDSLFDDYLMMLRADRDAHDLFRKYQVNFIVLTTHRPHGQPLAKLGAILDKDPEWCRVYANHDAVAWVLRAEFPELAAKSQVFAVPFATLEIWHGNEED